MMQIVAMLVLLFAGAVAAAPLIPWVVDMIRLPAARERLKR